MRFSAKSRLNGHDFLCTPTNGEDHWAQHLSFRLVCESPEGVSLHSLHSALVWLIGWVLSPFTVVLIVKVRANGKLSDNISATSSA